MAFCDTPLLCEPKVKSRRVSVSPMFTIVVSIEIFRRIVFIEIFASIWMSLNIVNTMQLKMFDNDHLLAYLWITLMIKEKQPMLLNPSRQLSI